MLSRCKYVISTRHSVWFDRAGLAVSGACAVHCALVPLAFALLPSLTLALLSLRDPAHGLAFALLRLARYEAWTIAAAIALAFGTSFVAWRRRGARRGLAFASAGALLLVTALAAPSPWSHAVLAVAGGFALCLAHRANLRAADIEST
jgi:hypothetical protein